MKHLFDTVCFWICLASMGMFVLLFLYWVKSLLGIDLMTGTSLFHNLLF